MVKIKKININIDDTDKFITGSYPESGIYLVSDSQFVYVNKTTMLCLFLGTKNDCIDFLNIEEENETEKSNISESFVLKLVAATLSSEETKQQILNSK